MLHCPQCGRQFGEDVTVCPEDKTPLQADSTVATNVPVDPLVGRTFDEKYRLDERLGEGGMGTVYRATHLLIERPVAIKVLNPRFVEDEAAQERFRREARAAGRLQHSNAVAVTDFGRTSDGYVYIVMELLEGRSLRDLLGREGPLDTARSVSIMLQISAAVAAAHEAGIIHRDLKPGNIFIVQRKHAPPMVKVLDFGIAKLATEAAEGADLEHLTQTGVMIGTPRYMSPEQCDGAELTPASDVYSLGIILYEMLTGTTPFTGPTPLAVALKHSSEIPRPPRELVATIPPALEELVLHALEKKPADRPKDASELRRELYATAERLGLEHAAGFSAPTIETLRSAGTETPSGRLVIDIERMREQRAARTNADTSPVPIATLENEIVYTEGAGVAASDDASPSVPTDVQVRAQSGVAVEPSAVEQPAAAGRLVVPFNRKEAWRKLLRQPLVMMGISLAALFLIVGLLAFVITRSSSNAGSNEVFDEATGRYVTPGDSEPKRPAPTREPKTASEFYERGGYYFSVRNYDAAISDFRRALNLQKQFPAAQNRLGRALMAKGQLASATAEFRAAIDQQGGNYPAAQYNLGFALQQMGDTNGALNAYNNAINQRGGNYPDAYYQIGIILLNLRDRDAQAADSLRKAIEQNGGRDPEAQMALGTALARQKDYAGAEAAYRAAIEQRDGNYADAHYNLGLLYEKTEKRAEAVKEYETYLEQNPNAFNRQVVEVSLKNLRRQMKSQSSDQ
jgi:serine/threonine protein kinase/tetratricopeptide (TPR) repeat protein